MPTSIRRTNARCLVAMFLAMASLALAVRAEPFEHNVGSWKVVCDNLRHCEAAEVPREWPDPNGLLPEEASLRIARDAGPGTTATARLFLEDSYGQVHLYVPGAHIVKGRLDQDLSSADFARVLPALLAARTATVIADDRKHVLRLGGLRAVLEIMDLHQQRAGTVGALVATGRRSDSSVPAAPTLPRVRVAKLPAPRLGDAALVEKFRAVRLLRCEHEQLPTIRGGSALGQRVNDTQILVTFTCPSPGRNPPSGVWLLDDHPPYHSEPVKLPDDQLDADFIFEDGLLKTWWEESIYCRQFSWLAWNGHRLERVMNRSTACPEGSGVTFREWKAAIEDTTAVEDDTAR